MPDEDKRIFGKPKDDRNLIARTQIQFQSVKILCSISCIGGDTIHLTSSFYKCCFGKCYQNSKDFAGSQWDGDYKCLHKRVSFKKAKKLFHILRTHCFK